LIGGTPEENAQITREILRGRRGPKRDVVCLNAAPAFVAAGKVKTLAEGVSLAEQVIDSGAAMDKLEQLVAWTKRQARSRRL
jgi:anthranilate phosphoribosyltransferase